MKLTVLVTICALMLSTAASARTMLGCLRSFQLQPKATQDDDGHPDAFVPAVRGDKAGFYFFSGDDSGKSPLFIPLTADELKNGEFRIQFRHPDTKRLISLIGVDCDPRQPGRMAVRAIDADPEKSRLVANIEIAQDAAAGGALDAFVAMLVATESKTISSTSTGLGLMTPNLYPGMPTLGLNDPKLLKLYQDKKRGASDEIAQTYADSGPDFLAVNDELISRYQKLLQQSCDGVGVQAKQTVSETLEDLKNILALNARLKTTIKDGIEKTLPKALTEAKDKSFSSAERLKAFIAGHITQRITDLRGELANNKTLGDSDQHAAPAGAAIGPGTLDPNAHN